MSLSSGGYVNYSLDSIATIYYNRYMETPQVPQVPMQRKRGPVPRLGPVVHAGIYISEDLLVWAKAQEEGLSGLVRRLLADERKKRS
jgi:hypothetical protein